LKEIIGNKYRIESKLTTLLNSDLFKAFDLEDCEFVILEKYQNMDNDNFKRIIETIKKINTYESENRIRLTLKLIDSVEFHGQFYCIYENCKVEKFENADKISVLVNSILKIHEINIVHGRLVPVNIIICDGIPLIMGFGLANVVKIYTLTSFNRSFLPPELIKGNICSKESDYFLIGAIAYYLYTKKQLLTEAMINQIMRGGSPSLNYGDLTNSNEYDLVVNATKLDINTRTLKYEYCK
jgi:serine/threonine protein kinase